MSTVLLMTDTWQPTVLRLVPFSSNNARSPDRKGTATAMTSRNFPVLAVTRSSANSDTRSDVKSVNSYRSEMADDISVYSEANGSEVTTKTSITEQASGTNRRTKYAKKKIPEMHSEMKEAMKFSVQDLNDQLSSSSSFQSSENKDDSKDKYSKLDNTRTKLPKPSMCTSPEGKFYSPVNGVRRSVPLTPGEMELQRIRDSYYVEQVQKRKKYKLNINQLPRSTTPINDHDPDKLNMKQVIAFLQTKTSKDIQKKIINEKKGNLSTASSRSQSRSKVYDNSTTSPKIVHVKDNGLNLSRSNTEIRIEEKLEANNPRLNTGCVSVMSTKSTPNLPLGNTSTKVLKTTTTHSVKSFKDHSKDRKSSKHRPMKEFKLYRFLAIAPDDRSESLASSFGEAVATVEKSALRTESKVLDSPRKTLRRRSNREIGTAHVLHRHASSRSTATPPTTETIPSAEEQSKAIKLPVMSDMDNETADVDSDSCSTTSATCNSTKNSSTKEESSKYPKKGKSITFDENIDVNKTVRTIENDAQKEYVDTSTRINKAAVFPLVNFSGPRHIHINLPQEDKKNYSQEIVRLTLRQDKHATRVTSYMSDIQHNPSTPWHEQYVDESDDNLEHESALTTKLNCYQDGRHLLENSKYLHNITNNSFIKVRQKLRATNMYNSE